MQFSSSILCKLVLGHYVYATLCVDIQNLSWACIYQETPDTSIGITFWIFGCNDFLSSCFLVKMNISTALVMRISFYGDSPRNRRTGRGSRGGQNPYLEIAWGMGEGCVFEWCRRDVFGVGEALPNVCPSLQQPPYPNRKWLACPVYFAELQMFLLIELQ